MIRTYDGQRYEFIAPRRYIRRDGTETFLAIWKSACAKCGAPFHFTLPGEVPEFHPKRRCDLHKRPGQRVRKQFR